MISNQNSMENKPVVIIGHLPDEDCNSNLENPSDGERDEIESA